MPLVKVDVFLKEFSANIINGSAALFVGAGMSRPAGYVDWKGLLKDIAAELDLDIDREDDLVTLAQFHVNLRSRAAINQLLVEQFVQDLAPTENHHLLASLPIRVVWTTNYDNLLEQSYADAGKVADVKIKPTNFAATRPRAEVTIYKMHGDRADPAEAILCKEDYETYDEGRTVFSTALRGDLTQRTFLFLGFGFSDPNVGYILSRVRRLLEHNSRQHYCVVKKPDPTAGDNAKYDAKRFPHWLEDLRRYHIQPVVIDSYAEITQILAQLNQRSLLRNVFVSGSAAEYAPLGQDGLQELCTELGKQLMGVDANIVSGFGSGVGGQLVFGALSALPKNNDERLQLWPFPQSVPPGTSRSAFWTDYRTRMIRTAGICLVVSGNKHVKGQPVAADGVREEVAIARKLGRVVLPIGASGWVAKELWDEVMKDPARHFPAGVDLREELKTLGDDNANPAQIAKAAASAVRKLRR
jgi:hypothetical protein